MSDGGVSRDDVRDMILDEISNLREDIRAEFAGRLLPAGLGAPGQVPAVNIVGDGVTWADKADVDLQNVKAGMTQAEMETVRGRIQARQAELLFD